VAGWKWDTRKAEGIEALKTKWVGLEKQFTDVLSCEAADAEFIATREKKQKDSPHSKSKRKKSKRNGSDTWSTWSKQTTFSFVP
jgi:hypothetical protein